MTKNNEVTTPYGKGIIVDIEEYNHFKRYGIKLYNNPFSFDVAYFFLHELTLNN